jgi:hypothetical protein
MEFKTGMVVTGLPESDQEYSITNTSMTRGLVVSVSGEQIAVKVLEHENGHTGTHTVNAKYFRPVDCETTVVRTQEEYDALPVNYPGIIEFANGENWVFIKEQKGYALVVKDNASIKSGNATVRAWGNATVEASGNATVEASGNATVRAWGNATVRAWGNVQILNLNCSGELQTFANYRVVFMPRNLEEFLNFHGVEQRDGNAIMYKAVHGDDLHSNYNPRFIYEVGKTVLHDCNQRTYEDCGRGLHISTLRWALNFGESWDDLRIIECSVPLDKIVYPEGSDGKVRTSELTVLRVVPLEECGVFGKILSKKQTAKEVAENS